MFTNLFHNRVMLRSSLFLILCLLLQQAAKAAGTDSLVLYLKNSGQQVLEKDSADYYRVILSPDTNVDRELYRVFEFYPDGKPKTVALSLTQPYLLALHGTCIEYFPNGNRKRVSFYKKGLLVDTVKNYYPNGRLYNLLKIEFRAAWYNDVYYNSFVRQNLYSYKSQIIEMRDSTGKVLAEKGNGHVQIYDNDFKNLVEEGIIKNNKKEGEWRGTIADSGKFICTFHNDVLKSGITYLKSGHHYEFKHLYESPGFGDWPGAFNTFIKKNLQYPEAARKYKITGSVELEFYIEPNGSVSNVKVFQGILKSLDEEAVRVISMSPMWYPATRFGVPLRTRQTVSVSFYEAYFNHSR